MADMEKQIRDLETRRRAGEKVPELDVLYSKMDADTNKGHDAATKKQPPAQPPKPSMFKRIFGIPTGQERTDKLKQDIEKMKKGGSVKKYAKGGSVKKYETGGGVKRHTLATAMEEHSPEEYAEIREHEAGMGREGKNIAESVKRKEYGKAAVSVVKGLGHAVGTFGRSAKILPSLAADEARVGVVRGLNKLTERKERNKKSEEGYKKGGSVSSRGDGVAQRGKTKGRFV